ncbi:protein ECT2-like isoform X1 [Sycon ciliatum]|uniref:protein ECT2-like isoform X1 n=1 Tax=Sycon ciliatum TaxID=27933 RepID=UPI0031F63388
MERRSARLRVSTGSVNHSRYSLTTLNEDTFHEVGGEAWLCVVGEDLRDDSAIAESAKVLELQVAFSNEAKIPDEVPSGCDLAFVVSNFDGALFDKLWSKVRSLRSSHVRILGPPCLHYCAAAKTNLPFTRRPVYSLNMSGLEICFMGFRSGEKKDMDGLVMKVRYMGADVRTDISDVSHVVAPNVTSSRYEKAVALGRSIMSTQWVEACWDSRHDLHVRATDDNMMQHRLPPFKDLTLSFCGFSEEDRQQMESFCDLNGCKAVPYSESCTHVVCSPDLTRLDDMPTGAVAVKADWFWESIQIRACSNSNLHLFQSVTQSTPSRSPSCRPFLHRPGLSHAGPSPLTTPNAFVFPSSSPSLPLSSVSTAGSVTSQQLTLEPTNSPISEVAESPTMTKLNKKLAERRNKCLELQETEVNYVAILNYIVNSFVEPLELPNQIGGAILNPEEVKEMFYPLPQLAALHEKMLCSLQNRFSVTTITDTTCFGDILLKHVDEMIQIYPRFINFYEGRQETVTKKSKSNPRFMAFMKLRYSEAAKLHGPFSKQTLTELLITPVQRMPRYLLLLEGIIKLTTDDHSDKDQLRNALAGFKTAAQRINDDKRIAEGRIKMLSLPNLVEGLPPTTLSSSRSIIEVMSNLYVVEGSDSGGTVEIPVCIIIFNDSVEIAKRRGHLESISLDDFNANSSLRTSGKRGLRHIDFFQLGEIKKLLRYFADAEQSTDLFGISVASSTHGNSQEQWIVFRAAGTGAQSGSEQVKSVIDALLKAREGVICTDADSFIQSVSRSTLPFFDSTSNEPHTPNGLSKAIRGARSKARRVTRVFSHHFHN